MSARPRPKMQYSNDFRIVNPAERIQIAAPETTRAATSHDCIAARCSSFLPPPSRACSAGRTASRCAGLRERGRNGRPPCSDLRPTDAASTGQLLPRRPTQKRTKCERPWNTQLRYSVAHDNPSLLGAPLSPAPLACHSRQRTSRGARSASDREVGSALDLDFAAVPVPENVESLTWLGFGVAISVGAEEVPPAFGEADVLNISGCDELACQPGPAAPAATPRTPRRARATWPSRGCAPRESRCAHWRLHGSFRRR